MTTNLYRVSGGTTGAPSDLDQVVDALTGNNDTDIVAYVQITAPTAPNVALSTTQGVLSGNYQYAVGFGTGYWQGVTGTGTLHLKGNTGGGAQSVVVTPTNEQVTISNIATGGTGVVVRYLYRTKSNGSAFYLLQQIDDNTTTTWVDNTPDSSLTEAMPTTNTTGSKFVGDGSGLTGIVSASEIAQPNGIASLDATGNVPSSQLGNASHAVASTRNTLITSTSATNVVTYTPTASGIFRVCVYLRIITATTNITLTTSYVDSGGTQSYTPPALDNQPISVGSHSVIDYTFEAVSGNTIALSITSSSANQVYVTAAIEEVA